ncbi:MAG: fatty acid cis/trans isomerase [Pseudomonadales bacterium]
MAGLLRTRLGRPTNKRTVVALLLLLLAIGCTPMLLHQLDEQFGVADNTRYDKPTKPIVGAPEYWRDVRPVLEQRCTVCHGCYDAPCQQNLTSWDGIARGANAELVYGTNLRAVEPTRLFVDAQLPSEWRSKKFHPVLNERDDVREANLQGSVLYRVLDLKRKNPLPTAAILDAKVFDFSLDRKQTCPAIENMTAFEKDHAQWGMPFGLPALSSKEFATVESWLAAGAPVAVTPALPAAIQKQIVQWEAFFNGTALKQQLVNRYLYEHLYLAHLYFDEAPAKNRHFFRLVRSSTPPGEAIVEIATRRPYDDPAVKTFWYRLRLETGSIVEKTHMPYALNSARMAKWKKWFIDADYAVSALPSYAAEVAGNPFVAFQSLPVQARYRFLLDEARFIIDTFIKGPVCRGQVALGVIEDHFWVFFVDPDRMPPEETAEFLARESKNLRLPAEDESNAGVLDWLKYSRLQQAFLKAKAQALQKVIGNNNNLTLDLVWNGGADNDNAALTVFRHSDSASVVKGLVGQPPETAWLISYGLLERIYYLLVAGFDVYGSVGHQLNTRLYMDFLRMEGEANFLALLPRASRTAIRDFWYRGASDNVKQYLYGEHFNFAAETNIVYRTQQPQQELYSLLKARLGNNVPQEFSLTKESSKGIRTMVDRLQNVRGAGLAVFPQNSILRVDDAGQSHYFTLLNNSSYSNISQLLQADARRRPNEDYLTVVPGIIGAYPNAFFVATADNAMTFASMLKNMKTEADYTALADAFAVRRTNPDFWRFSDALHDYYAKQQPIASGILDYNRLENR